MIRVLLSYSKISSCGMRKFHSSSRLLSIYEPPRSNYPIVYDIVKKKQNLTLFEKWKEACRFIKENTFMFFREMKQSFIIHHDIIALDCVDIFWKFDGTEGCREQWILTCDSDYNQGFSTAKLEFTPSGTGLFHGNLDPRLPKDGKIGRAGYCNITTISKTISFNREISYDFSSYNSIVLRVRGDGRCYMVNFLQKGKLDITRYRSFHFFMYTTGGPYWQEVRIPFAKCVYCSKGEVRDDQTTLPLRLITHIGITISDSHKGPFKLEIDSIGFCYDSTLFEESPYEMINMKNK